MFKIGIDISEVLSEGGAFTYTFVHTEAVNGIEQIIPKINYFITLLQTFVEEHKK